MKFSTTVNSFSSDDKCDIAEMFKFLLLYSNLVIAISSGVILDNAINLFKKEEADSLFSATRLSDLTLWEKSNNNWRSTNFDYQNRFRRQDMTPNYIENGSIYIFKPEILINHNNRLGGKIISYEMQFWQTWEIDSIHEIDLIEFFMVKYKLGQHGTN